MWGTSSVRWYFHTISASPYNNATLSGGQATPAVTGGPDDGYYYVTLTSPFVMDRAYSLNPWIENPGPMYWHGNRTWEYVESTGGDPAFFHNKATAHEVQGSTLSHRGRQDVAATADAACGDVVKALERLVTGTSGEMTTAITQTRERSRQAIWYLSSHVYVNGFQGAPNPVADWRSKPDTVDGLTDVTTDTIGPPPSTHCDVTGV